MTVHTMLKWYLAGLVLAAGMILAAGMEGLHYLLPYRTYNVNDALSNGMGVLVGGAVAAGWRLAVRA
ncbi:MAG: hypothetical protein K9L23_20840 [Desulfotignum sp.]|nr:hypothetical protein [Desulfotignum sp.]